MEKKRFLRKWLLSMYEGEERQVPTSKFAYTNLKSTCYQMKKMSMGEWKCTKKQLDGFTRVTRVK